MWKLSDVILVDTEGYYWLAMEMEEFDYGTIYREATIEEVGCSGFANIEDAKSRISYLRLKEIQENLNNEEDLC